jgi:transketolase
MSCVEILLALYYNVAKTDPHDPKMEDRDRIVLSKGHACPALYAVLADKGFFPRSDLWSLRQIHSHLQGHPDSTKTPGVDVNTGKVIDLFSPNWYYESSASHHSNGIGAVYATCMDPQ